MVNDHPRGRGGRFAPKPRTDCEQLGLLDDARGWMPNKHQENEQREADRWAHARRMGKPQGWEHRFERGHMVAALRERADSYVQAGLTVTRSQVFEGALIVLRRNEDEVARRRMMQDQQRQIDLAAYRDFRWRQARMPYWQAN